VKANKFVFLLRHRCDISMQAHAHTHWVNSGYFLHNLFSWLVVATLIYRLKRIFCEKIAGLEVDVVVGTSPVSLWKR